MFDFYLLLKYKTSVIDPHLESTYIATCQNISQIFTYIIDLLMVRMLKSKNSNSHN